MIKLSSKRKALLTAVLVIVALAVLSTTVFAFPVAAAVTEENTERQVLVKARGVALNKVNNQTERLPVNMTLVLYLGEGRRHVIPIKAAEGTLNINGTLYNITSGRGIILTEGHVALLTCSGEGDNGEITVKLLAEYFWMGGHLYAVRSRGICITDNARMGS